MPIKILWYMARSKYDPKTFPILVEGYAREGMVEADMAKKLGITKSTFEVYKKKYQDFSDSLKRGKGPVDFKVENSLLKRALGYDYDEIHEETKIEESVIGEGDKAKKSVKTKTFRKVVHRHVAGDVTAAIFWLKNRKPDKWRDRVPEGGVNTEDMTDVLKDFGDLIIQGDLDG